MTLTSQIAGARFATPLVLAAPLVAGCTGIEAESSSPGRPRNTGAQPGNGGAVVRRCGDDVFGDIGSDWRRTSVVIGPIAFVTLRFAATNPPITPTGGHAAVYKTLALVEPGRTVTMTIGADVVRHASLLYDPHVFRGDNVYSIADGSRTVTFVACPDRSTQFNGSILVDGARCVPLEVVSGPGESRRHVPVSLGAGKCPKRDRPSPPRPDRDRL